MNQSTEKLDYLPGLDGIRAVAALLVISTHWPNNNLSLKFGWIGVNIFFVLSGFLITRILVHNKRHPFKKYITSFFYKRVLRIFPIYYLFFFIVAAILLFIYFLVPPLSHDRSIVAGISMLKYDTPFFLTYTYNLKLNLNYLFHWTDNSNQYLGHLWSLSVEEQFYLIFPFIVYFSSIKTLKKILIGIVIVCPLIRLWAATIGIHLVTNRYWLGEFLYTNTFCQADALATGALLAIYPFKLKLRYGYFFLVALLCLVVGLTCLFFLRKAGYFLIEGKSLGFNFPGYWLDEKTPWFLINIRAFYQYTLVNLLALFLIAPAVLKKPLFPVILTSKPISYLGKISYGVYLFHNPLMALFILISSLFGGWFVLTANPIIHLGILTVYLALLFLLAHFSYEYFEQKILTKYRKVE